MFNFNCISPYEFESLSKDIMQIMTGEELRIYAPGPDDGIDLRGFSGNNLIIQVKHYPKSRFSNLRTSLKKELKKVEKLKPKRYMIVTSLELTHANEEEIYNLFKLYMNDTKSIIDRPMIEAFLEENENIDILKKHTKLWLTSTNVLDIIFHRELDNDSSAFWNDYEKKVSLLVFSKTYFEAIEILNNHDILIIDGDPGVGKTTLSKMIVSYFISEGYKLIFASGNSISEIKKNIDKNEKKVILMDNFLGQRIDIMGNYFFDELKTLIGFANCNKNIKIILNSRSIVFNEAESSSQTFKELLDNCNIGKLKIDLVQLDDLEKMKIVCNHLSFNEVPPSYIVYLKEYDKYLEIIEHKNFNPRIIEYVTKKNVFCVKDEKSFFSYIMEILNNPKDIWKEEFSYLTKSDRIFIHTLYSLISYEESNRQIVKSSVLKECFEHRLEKDNSVDTTIDHYERAINKLTGSIIKVFLSEDESKIGFINPSVEDYLYSELSKLDLEIKEISKSSLYIEQLINLNKLNSSAASNTIVKKIEENEFLTLKSFSKINKYYFYLKFVYNNRLINNFVKCKNIIFEAFNSYDAFMPFGREENACLIADYFFDDSIYHLYGLENLFNNNEFIIKVFKYFNFEQIIQFVNKFDKKLEFLEENVLESIGFLISWEIGLDIVHNEKNKLDIGINNWNKRFLEQDISSEIEVEQFCNAAEVSFVNNYLTPLAYERKNIFKSHILYNYLIDIDVESILDEIDFMPKLINETVIYEINNDEIMYNEHNISALEEMRNLLDCICENSNVIDY